MRALFGRGMHPDAEAIIAVEVAAGATPQDAERAAKLGRAFPQYTPLPPRSERVAARVAAFQAENGHPPSPMVRSKLEAQEARRDRRAVAGYDLVFTPVKSASVLWALGSAHTRAAVEDAHHQAVADTLAWLERETAFARTGDHGEAQIDTRGFVAAAFDHRDSRAGDPELHTQLAISNNVRALHDHPDGRPRWLSLVARVLHAAAVAASERYNTRFEDALCRRLPVAFADRPDTVRDDRRVIREITGIPTQLLKHFSKRRDVIEDRYRTLAADYRHTHGHEPPRETQLKLAQQATLETRDANKHPSALAEKITGWRAEAATVIGTRGVDRLDCAVAAPPRSITHPADLPIEAVAASVVDVVSAEKASWTRWNLIAETERQLRPLRFSDPGEPGGRHPADPRPRAAPGPRGPAHPGRPRGPATGLRRRRCHRCRRCRRPGPLPSRRRAGQRGEPAGRARLGPVHHPGPPRRRAAAPRARPHPHPLRPFPRRCGRRRHRHRSRRQSPRRTRAGVGDHIVTRRNHRRLTDKRAGSFVKNGDTWTVTRHHHNGDLTVTRTGGPLSPARSRGIRLPADYVAAHVELAHATTTARAQGRTVDTAHVLVDDTLARESLYVAATRGRKHTTLYVQTEQSLDLNAERPPHSTPEPADVLRSVLGHQSAEISATQIQRDNPRPQRSTPHPRPTRHGRPATASVPARQMARGRGAGAKI